MRLNGIKVMEYLGKQFQEETGYEPFHLEVITVRFRNWLKDKQLIEESNAKFLGKVNQ